jgi:hypothetical protein
MMADILCPVCGKSNPADLAECQFCQAPLRTSAFTAIPGEGAEMPDWLSDMHTGGEEEQVEDLGSQDNLPDWLREKAEPPTGQPSSQEEEPLPDWLEEHPSSDETLVSKEPPTPAPTDETLISGRPEPPTPSGGTEGGPDWLSELLGREAPSAQPAKEMPDWLTQEPPPAGEAVSPPETPSAEPAETPDWLTGLGAQPTEEAAPFDQEAGEGVSPFESAESSDWLSRLGTESAESSPSSVPAFTFDEEEPKPESGEGGETENDRFLATLPDWVSQVSAEEQETPEAGESLAPAQLPGWVEAMRPAGTEAPSAPVEDLTGVRPEMAGPLSGLRGVLVAEPDAIHPRRPPAYSLKLRVTDEQRARVALLDDLLAAEQKPKPLPAQPVITTQYISRLMIALALILPVLWVVISASNHMALPDPDSLPGVLDLRQQVDALPGGAPVLVAFDYEPGFSGEMDAAASAVVADLMGKGAYLVLVSTSPLGPPLAERFIANLNDQPDSQGPYTNYTDLGYIPGGAMGIISLAQTPRQLLPYSLDGLDVWSNPPLSGISKLADFSLLLVLTDDPDTARSWIEQAGPTLREKNTPLVMVTSAQAEPLVRPYYEGIPRQLSGLVAGIAGGAAYENASGVSGLARLSWDAFSAGLLVSVLTILVGALVGVVSKTLISSKEKQG